MNNKMNTLKKALDSKSVRYWAIILVAACLVYAAGISHESIWYDEVYSAIMSEYSMGEIISLSSYDNHPPLYYMLLRMVQVVWGTSDWALRALSVVGAVALVGLGAGPVRRIFGNKTGLIFSVVTLFTPDILTYAHEARAYILATLAVTAGVLYGYLAVQNGRWTDWIGFGITTFAASYLHIYALIAAFYTHLFLLIWILAKKREHLKSYLITGGVVLLGILPWLIVFVDRFSIVNKGFWIKPFSPYMILEALIKPFAYKDIFPGIQPAMMIVFLLTLIMIIYGVIYAMKKGHKRERAFVLYGLGIFLCAFITPIVVSIFLTPVFFYRYTLVFTGLYLLLLSLGISLLPGKYLGPATVGCFMLLNVFTIKDIYTQFFNEPMKVLAQDLQDEIRPGDLIVTTDDHSMGSALYYFPDADHYYSNNDFDIQWGQLHKIFDPYLFKAEDKDNILSTHQSFWYITNNSGKTKNVWTFLKGEEGWQETLEPRTYSVPYSHVQFSAAKYSYTGQPHSQNQGTLKIHLTGTQPIGYILVRLYDKGRLFPEGKPIRFETVIVSDEELSYVFDGLEFGDYVLVLAHDENKNSGYDIDRKNRLPIEGGWIMNIEKMDLSTGFFVNDLTFEKYKFSFNKPERTIEAQMMYPPFPGQNALP